MAQHKVIRHTVEGDGILIATFDAPEKKVNTLSPAVFQEIKETIDEAREDNVRGIIFISAKDDNFIAGADINTISDFTTAEDAAHGSSLAQQLFAEIEHLPMPTLAAINGSCLGGGTELALACTYRLLSDNPKTIMSLPEVMLGVLPGAGGTQRLPRLIGLQNSLDMLLTGKNVRGKKCHAMGLADGIAPQSQLLEHARKIMRELIDKKITRTSPAFEKLVVPKRKSKAPIYMPAMNFFLEKTRPGTELVFKKAREKVLKSTNGRYPAPLKILDVVKTGICHGAKRGYEAEAKAFGELAMTPEARSLIHIFFSTTELKKDNGTANPDAKGRTLSKVGVLGAGLMGAGISTVAMDKCKLPVRMKDMNVEALARGYNYVENVFLGQLKKKRLTSTEFPLAMGLLTTSTTYEGFKHCDIVIEAVFEDVKLKRQMIKDIEDVGGGKIIFASNTSSISIATLAAEAKHPEMIVGMHFFSPVHKMPLLEVIKWEKNTDEVVATAVELGRKMGKHVIVVNDGVGFYTTRALSPYMNEAAYLFYEGYKVEDIDKAMLDFGFPVGPLTLLDEVGIDVGGKITKIMIEAFGARMEPPAGWDAILKDNRFGRKNKRGFYTYTTEKKVVDESIYKLRPLGTPMLAANRDELQKRLSLSFINEAVLCLQEGILRSPRDGDIGAIFGLGFPPFTGGPFRYIDSVGPQLLVDQLVELSERFGKRFAPAQLLVDYAKKNLRFYPEGEKAPELPKAVRSH